MVGGSSSAKPVFSPVFTSGLTRAVDFRMSNAIDVVDFILSLVVLKSQVFLRSLICLFFSDAIFCSKDFVNSSNVCRPSDFKYSETRNEGMLSSAKVKRNYGKVLCANELTVYG